MLPPLFQDTCERAFAMRGASEAELPLLLTEAWVAACGDITCMALIVSTSFSMSQMRVHCHCEFDVGKAAVGLSLAPQITSSLFLWHYQASRF